MKLASMIDLYANELRDLLHAEKQLVKAIPRVADACASAELRAAFVVHLQETEGHVERLETILKGLGLKPAGQKCEAMAGLIEEASEIINAEGESDVRDAGLIVAAQKVEHYEIAAYGSLCAFARILGRSEDQTLLATTLEEEKHADGTLTRIAEQTVNRNASAAV